MRHVIDSHDNEINEAFILSVAYGNEYALRWLEEKLKAKLDG